MASASTPAVEDGSRPLIKRPKDANAYHTLLCVDGGGIRGIVPTMVLLKLEGAIKKHIFNHADKCIPPEHRGTIHSVDDFDIDLTDYFELSAGTSVGSLITTYIASRGTGLDVQQVNEDAKAALKNLGKAKDPRTWNPLSWLGNRTREVDVPEDVKERYAPVRRGSVSAIRTIFHTYGSTIFPQTKKRGMLSSLFDARYLPDGLNKVAKLVFADATMSDLVTDCLVTSFDVDRNTACSFVRSVGANPTMATVHTIVRQKTRHSAGDGEESPQKTTASEEWKPDLDYVEGTNYYLRDICMSSSSAPTFFPPASITPLEGPDRDPLRLVDGGVMATNPVLQALTYAIETFTEDDIKELAIFSVGCGVAFSEDMEDKDPGVYSWILTGYLTQILMAGASEYIQSVVDYWLYKHAKLKYGQYVRIQIEAPRGTEENKILAPMDKPEILGQLETIGKQLGDSNEKDIDVFVEKYIFATKRAN